jgi:hypothetical protein
MQGHSIILKASNIKILVHKTFDADIAGMVNSHPLYRAQGIISLYKGTKILIIILRSEQSFRDRYWNMRQFQLIMYTQTIDYILIYIIDISVIWYYYICVININICLLSNNRYCFPPMWYYSIYLHQSLYIYIYCIDFIWVCMYCNDTTTRITTTEYKYSVSGWLSMMYHILFT